MDLANRLVVNLNAIANGPENTNWQGIPLPNCPFFKERY
jgi:hypothetical protein